MPLVIALLAGGAVGALVLGLGRPGSRQPQRRTLNFVGAARTRESDSDESFAVRVARPATAAIARRATSLLPSQLAAAVAARLRVAGWSMSAESYLLIWAASGLLLPTLLAILMLSSEGHPGTARVGLLLGWYAAGAYGPWYVLRRAADRRTKAVDRSLPDAIDLVVTSVESGIALQGAMLNVSRKFGGPIGEEFQSVITETSVGRPRAEALESMADRTGSRDVRTFVRAVNQAESMGISIASVLRNQAAELRERRRQAAREKANKVPVKMTIPTVLFIFPTMFLLVIGPVALRAAEILRE